jgi:hypothetical protein
VFPASRSLSEAESGRLLATVDSFLDQWTAHGAPLVVARTWQDGRFLLVGVDEKATGVSGCSVDALVRSLRGVESELGIQLTDHAPVVYRDGDTIKSTSRADFSGLARSGNVGPHTPVFDNSITTVGELHEGRWETRAGESWHRTLLEDVQQ